MFRILLTAIAFTTPAFAAPVAGTASLAADASKDRIVTDAGVWTCTGATCSGRADTVTSLAVAACTAVADKAGRVSSFSAGNTAFGDAELARCNRHLGK